MDLVASLSHGVPYLYWRCMLTGFQKTLRYCTLQGKTRLNTPYSYISANAHPHAKSTRAGPSGAQPLRITRDHPEHSGSRDDHPGRATLRRRLLEAQWRARSGQIFVFLAIRIVDSVGRPGFENTPCHYFQGEIDTGSKFQANGCV